MGGGNALGGLEPEVPKLIFKYFVNNVNDSMNTKWSVKRFINSKQNLFTTQAHIERYLVKASRQGCQRSGFGGFIWPALLVYISHGGIVMIAWAKHLLIPINCFTDPKGKTGNCLSWSSKCTNYICSLEAILTIN